MSELLNWGDEILSIPDPKLDLMHKVIKYAGYAFVMAASTETAPANRIRFSDRSIEYCDVTKQLLREAKRAKNGDLAETLDWLRNDDTEPRVDYISAMAYCMKSVAEQKPELGERARQAWDNIPPYFKVANPVEGTPELKDCIRN